MFSWGWCAAGGRPPWWQGAAVLSDRETRFLRSDTEEHPGVGCFLLQSHCGSHLQADRKVLVNSNWTILDCRLATPWKALKKIGLLPSKTAKIHQMVRFFFSLLDLFEGRIMFKRISGVKVKAGYSTYIHRLLAGGEHISFSAIKATKQWLFHPHKPLLAASTGPLLQNNSFFLTQNMSHNGFPAILTCDWDYMSKQRKKGGEKKSKRV